MSRNFSDVLHCGICRVGVSCLGVEVGTGGSSVYESQCERVIVV